MRSLSKDLAEGVEGVGVVVVVVVVGVAAAGMVVLLVGGGGGGRGLEEEVTARGGKPASDGCGEVFEFGIEVGRGVVVILISASAWRQ